MKLSYTLELLRSELRNFICDRSKGKVEEVLGTSTPIKLKRKVHHQSLNSCGKANVMPNL